MKNGKATRFCLQHKKISSRHKSVNSILVEEGGFEPPKSATTDLQSAPFGHSGTLPYEVGAGGRTRTPDLLITNQLLYQLSYTSVFNSSTARVSLSEKTRLVNTKFQKF